MNNTHKTANTIWFFLVVGALSGVALILTPSCKSTDGTGEPGASAAAEPGSPIEKIEPGADLRKMKLAGADLKGANMPRVNLGKVNLGGVNLSGANLYKASLVEADLSGADLSGVNLYLADLRGAKLVGANLSKADLNGAKLYKADITDAKCDDGTKLPKEFSCTEGLVKGGE